MPIELGISGFWPVRWMAPEHGIRSHLPTPCCVIPGSLSAPCRRVAKPGLKVKKVRGGSGEPGEFARISRNMGFCFPMLPEKFPPVSELHNSKTTQSIFFFFLFFSLPPFQPTTWTCPITSPWRPADTGSNPESSSPQKLPNERPLVNYFSV